MSSIESAQAMGSLAMGEANQARLEQAKSLASTVDPNLTFTDFGDLQRKAPKIAKALLESFAFGAIMENKRHMDRSMERLKEARQEEEHAGR